MTSAIPTLLMTGQYDPVTPEAFAASTAEGLSVASPLFVPRPGACAGLGRLVRRLRSRDRAAVPSRPRHSSRRVVHRSDAADRLPDRRRHPGHLIDLSARQRPSARSRPGADRDRGTDDPRLHRDARVRGRLRPHVAQPSPRRCPRRSRAGRGHVVRTEPRLCLRPGGHPVQHGSRSSSPSVCPVAPGRCWSFRSSRSARRSCSSSR